MKPKTIKNPESVVREIKRKTRRKFNSEEKIRIILEGLKGEDSIAAICRREGIAPSLYYKLIKTFLQAGKRRLNGDTIREANSYYNNDRYHEALQNLTPADVYYGRSRDILSRRKRIKKNTMLQRRRYNCSLKVA